MKKDVPEFKGYNKPVLKEGKIQDIVCENIKRQALEKAKDNKECFYYNKKKVKVGKGVYVHYGVREKQILNDLLIQKGVVFYFSPLKFYVHNVVRRLKLKGHLIKNFNFVHGSQTARKNKIPHFILIYYAGKEKEAYEKLLEKIPKIKGVPQYTRKFAVPIKRNLHNLGTEQCIRWQKYNTLFHTEKICFCGMKFTDKTKSQTKKYCSQKCTRKAKRIKAKEWRMKNEQTKNI